jgi:hypothetical protein
VPGVKLEGGELAGKLATIWLADALNVGKLVLSRVTTGLLPKFCPVMVNVPLL